MFNKDKKSPKSGNLKTLKFYKLSNMNMSINLNDEIFGDIKIDIPKKIVCGLKTNFNTINLKVEKIQN